MAIAPPSPMCGGVAWAASPIRTTRPACQQRQFDPFDRPEVDLVVVLQRGEVGRDRPAEAPEPLPEPFQAAGWRIVEAIPVQAGEPVGAPVRRPGPGRRKTARR